MPYSHANGALSVVMAGCYLAGAYLSWALKTDLMFSTQSALPLKLRIYICYWWLHLWDFSMFVFAVNTSRGKPTKL